jgi:hypothetical protein
MPMKSEVKSCFGSVFSEPCVGGKERIARNNAEFIFISISWERTYIFEI